MRPNRRLLLNLRRSVKVQRRFDVVDLGEGRVRLTCQTCGSTTESVAGADSRAVKSGATRPPAPGSFEAKLLARWWANVAQNGISGSCDTCLRQERDLRYPLPAKGE